MLETTMKVSRKFLTKLDSEKKPKESYQECLERLLDF